MFKRFHDKQGQSKSDNKTHLNATYAQIKKELTAKKTNYSQRHQKNKMEITEDKMELTLECHKTEEYLFQGVVKGKVKCGEGVLMLKNGTLIFGRWSNGWLDGRALIFTPFRAKILANFHQGKLNGWVIAFYSTHIIRCTLYYENQIDGEKLTFDEKQQMWVASKCTSEGKIKSIIHAEKGSRGSLPSFVNSEELKDMFGRFAVMRESFIETNLLDQFEISLTTSYIGFVDKERKPFGLGCAYSDTQMYCGNFFEGILQHYGRMLFENGDIYQGQMMGGNFCGKGMYYSPTTNQTCILFSTEKEQKVENQFSGYILIDIEPPIGLYKEQSETGIKGQALKKAIECLQPYYLKQFSSYKTGKIKSKSNASQYGCSEDMILRIKDGKESYSKQDKKSKQEEQASPSFVGENKHEQRWLKFGSHELNDIALKKTQSLDKREAAAIKKAGLQRKLRLQNFEAEDEEQQRRVQSNVSQQMNSFGKIDPNRKEQRNSRMMKQIPFGKPSNIQTDPKQVQKSQPKKSNMYEVPGSFTLPFPEKKKAGENEYADSYMGRQASEHSQYVSGEEKRLTSLLDKGKNNRKKIFF